MNIEDFCLRCGELETHSDHKCEKPDGTYGGWHPFRGQNYLDGLEDALLYAREENKPHNWKFTGVITTC